MANGSVLHVVNALMDGTFVTPGLVKLAEETPNIPSEVLDVLHTLQAAQDAVVQNTEGLYVRDIDLSDFRCYVYRYLKLYAPNLNKEEQDMLTDKVISVLSAEEQTYADDSALCRIRTFVDLMMTSDVTDALMEPMDEALESSTASWVRRVLTEVYGTDDLDVVLQRLEDEEAIA